MERRLKPASSFTRVVTTLEQLDEAVREFRREFPEGAVTGMYGDLGAGKTTFVRTLLHQIAKENQKTLPRVVSPSFVIHQSYASLSPPVEHFDLYRLEHAEEAALLELGYFETIDRCREAHGFVFVEWPQHAVEKALRLDVKLLLELEPSGSRRLRW